jgi:putative oxidoreductase
MNHLAKLWFRFFYDPENPTKSDWGLLIVRVVFGLGIIVGHGWSKFTGFSESAATFLDPLGIGSQLSLGLTVFAEVFCAVAVVVGFKTRAAVLPLLFTMFVVLGFVHLGDPFSGIEKAVLYFAAYAALLVAGPGKYSLDAVIARKLKARSPE